MDRIEIALFLLIFCSSVVMVSKFIDIYLSIGA